MISVKAVLIHFFPDVPYKVLGNNIINFTFRDKENKALRIWVTYLNSHNKAWYIWNLNTSQLHFKAYDLNCYIVLYSKESKKPFVCLSSMGFYFSSYIMMISLTHTLLKNSDQAEYHKESNNLTHVVIYIQ